MSDNLKHALMFGILAWHYVAPPERSRFGFYTFGVLALWNLVAAFAETQP